MRTPCLLALMLGLACSAGAWAGGQMVGPGPQRFSGHPMQPSWSGSGWNRPGATWGFGHGNGHWHDWDDHFHRFGRVRFVYFLPLVAQPQYVVTEAAEAAIEPAYAMQADYVPMPAYPPPAPIAAPPAPSQTIEYATSGQPITIPAGAHVTKGSVYKYTKDGVQTYTNIPPPDSAKAKMLFDYTEVVSTKATHTLYRCIGDKPGQVRYADKPVANADCKTIQYDDAAAD